MAGRSEAGATRRARHYKTRIAQQDTARGRLNQAIDYLRAVAAHLDPNATDDLARTVTTIADERNPT